MENFNDSKALAIEIAKILDKKKAHDVRVLKVESLTVLTDYFVIASGTSTTQVASLADEVEFELSQKGLEPYSTEGYDSKNWVLLDYSNVIVHVFVPNTRTYYDLEHLWADEPIDISEYLTPTAPLNDSGKQVYLTPQSAPSRKGEVAQKGKAAGTKPPSKAAALNINHLKAYAPKQRYFG